MATRKETIMDIITQMMSEEVPVWAGVYNTPYYQQPIRKKAFLDVNGEFVIPTISTYEHLTETLTFAPEFQQQFNEWASDKQHDDEWDDILFEYIVTCQQWHVEYTLDTRFEDTCFDRQFVAMAIELVDDANENIVIVRTLNGNNPEYGLSRPYFFRPRYVRRMREYGSGLEVFDIHRIDVVCPQCNIEWHNEYDGSFVHTVDKPEGSVSPNAEFTFTWDGTSQCPFCKTTLEGAY